ncbi:MAG TPA: nucleotidyl transferase AbiEii/AbiGii toxin family protein [Patescibacteria group bacterium]|nr:nucleotidyl transferase AbiEii/AbiGii toxin family protein [Patescibacteria group bacterium]
MIQLNPSDAAHRSAMYKILIAIADDPVLSHSLIFKGGTAAAMLGFLDRFSVDLDFDRMKRATHTSVEKNLESIFSNLSLPVVKKHPNVLMYRVRYADTPAARATVKVSVNEEFVASSIFAPQYLPDIDRTMICQTKESMVSHKWVALINRYTKHKEIAGRDVYDIHEFLLRGYAYDPDIIKEQTGYSAPVYIKKMIAFIQKHVIQQIIDEDLNILLSPTSFQSLRKVLVPETLTLLRTELAKLV